MAKYALSGRQSRSVGSPRNVAYGGTCAFLAQKTSRTAVHVCFLSRKGSCTAVHVCFLSRKGSCTAVQACFFSEKGHVRRYRCVSCVLGHRGQALRVRREQADEFGISL